MSNREISRLFNLYAELLLLHATDERLSALLSGAAYRLRNMAEEIIDLPKNELSKLFRPEIAALVEAIKKSGTISQLDELIQLTPSGLFDMMRIKGLGGKKLSVLWKTAKVDSVEGLLEIAKKGGLATIPGFGKKTEANIIAAIEAFTSNQQFFRYAEVAEIGDNIISALQKYAANNRFSLCGDIRRQSTTLAAIEIITDLPAEKLNAAPIRKVLTVQSTTDAITNAHSLDEIPVIIYHTNSDDYYTDLFTRTGNEAHVKKIISKIKVKSKPESEEVIYERAKLPFILPELREDNAEWNLIKGSPDLITTEDIKGVVHNHTTYSDGVDTLPDFVSACKKLKYEYTVISDHSKNAHYAGGLKEEKVLKQFKEIDQLNKKLKPFHIFKSIECDILVSGDLDYDTQLLKQFDLVIVSVHQLLKMNEEKATARLIKAIENPYTTILGHMTGRQLLIRPGYPVDFKKVIDACAANKVVIEINANPYRLDMDWSHIPYAIEKGVMISINPDAHSIGEIDNIKWGVSAARKGGLTKDMTWNALSLQEIVAWLHAKNKAL